MVRNEEKAQSMLGRRPYSPPRDRRASSSTASATSTTRSTSSRLHWERHVVDLRGPNYTCNTAKMTDLDGSNIIDVPKPSGRGHQEASQRRRSCASGAQLLELKESAIEEDPDDEVQRHQLGLHNLYTTLYEASVKFLKVAVARQKDCCFTWSILGISLQLSSDPSLAEEVYKRALSLATIQQAHAILNNLGNLYRQQKRFDRAKTIFMKSLELCPGYAPAHNNLGLVFVAEGQWDEARSCFEKALLSDPFLDAAKSNMMKAVSLSKSKRNNTTIVS